MRTLGVFLALSILATIGLTYKPIDREDKADRNIEFKTIDQSAMSAEEKNYNVVVKDKESWEKLWNETHSNQIPLPPVPEVDFTTKMVIVAFQGEKPTGGYSIEVKKIMQTNSKIKVSIDENSPGSECIVTQALTNPYHFVELRKLDGDVVYEEHKVVNHCN